MTEPLSPAAQAVDDRIAELEAELERERLRLAACGVVAMADTPESAYQARDIHQDLWSASLDDVIRQVDALMALRSAIEPVPVAERLPGPTDEELWELYDEMGGVPEDSAWCLKYARAVLARWGNHPESPDSSDGPAVSDGREPASVTEHPSDEEIIELMPQQMHDDLAAAARALAEVAGTDSRRAMGVMRIILNRHAVDHARAALAKWGHPFLNHQ
jgi:hypothetical protein